MSKAHTSIENQKKIYSNAKGGVPTGRGEGERERERDRFPTSTGVVWVSRAIGGSYLGVAGYDVSTTGGATSRPLLRGEEGGFGLWRL